MDFKISIWLTVFVSSVTSYNIGVSTESVASIGQLKYAEEQNYDDTGPGSKSPESAYAVYNNPEDAQLGYTDYSSSFEGNSQYDGFTPSPIDQSTPRFWSQLSEQEYKVQSSFTPISNAIQSPVPKFYTNTQTVSENPSIPSYYKMKPNLPYTSVVPYQLARQSVPQQQFAYQKVPYVGASNYRQISNGGQFNISPSTLYLLKQQQQGLQNSRIAYAAVQPTSYQRYNTFPSRQNRFSSRTPNIYQGNQISRTYRVLLPKYSEYSDYD